MRTHFLSDDSPAPKVELRRSIDEHDRLEVAVHLPWTDCETVGDAEAVCALFEAIAKRIERGIDHFAWKDEVA